MEESQPEIADAGMCCLLSVSIKYLLEHLILILLI